MQPYSTVTVQQLNDHLAALRLEAAQARLVSRQTSSGIPTLLGRVLTLFRWPARPDTGEARTHTL